MGEKEEGIAIADFGLRIVEFKDMSEEQQNKKSTFVYLIVVFVIAYMN